MTVKINITEEMVNGAGIERVTSERVSEIIKNYENSDSSDYGLWFAKDEESGKWIGIDNSDGHAWTEEFDTKELCVAWLLGQFEMSDLDEYIQACADETERQINELPKESQKIFREMDDKLVVDESYTLELVEDEPKELKKQVVHELICPNCQSFVEVEAGDFWIIVTVEFLHSNDIEEFTFCNPTEFFEWMEENHILFEIQNIRREYC